MTPKRGLSSRKGRVITKSTQEGCHEGEARFTFIMRETLAEKVKFYAKIKNLKIKDVVNSAFENYFQEKEFDGRDNGE